jgi:hypothetical protein
MRIWEEIYFMEYILTNFMLYAFTWSFKNKGEKSEKLWNILVIYNKNVDIKYSGYEAFLE